MHQLRSAYQRFRPFSDYEAWTLFRWAAFGEAIGWTLLIIGIICKELPVSWHNIPVLITGQIHGTLFIIYIAIALVTGPSLGWSPLKTLIAGLCSVPPYGSLVYEAWAAHVRYRTAAREFHGVSLYRQLTANELFTGGAQSVTMQV